MAEENDDGRDLEPTERRLEQARKRGDVIYSTEVSSAFSLLAVTLIVAFAAAPASGQLGRLLAGALSNAHAIPTGAAELRSLLMTISVRVIAAVGAAFLVLWIAGIISRLVQDKFGWSAERIKPKLERINPVEGFKRIFGMQALGNFAKTVLKLAIFTGAVTWALWPRDGTLAILPTMDIAAIGPLMQERTLALLMACTVAAAALGGADYVFTRQAYLKRQRMTRRDMKEEMKESEGDPEVRARLAVIRRERARKRMMAAVPQATVVITNPTHYAVALKYDRETAPTPVCVAKGVNEVALRIRETAESHAVPVIEDPPLARALYATAEIEETIPREHFEAVAKVIGYVLRLAERRRR